jgi:hypothetical protein
MTNPTELTGIEGFRAAMGEADRWEFDAPGYAGWAKLSDELEQNIGPKYLAQPGRRWRRIPNPQPADIDPPAEIERLTKECEEQRELYQKAYRINSKLVTEIFDLKTARDNALGSQKAALAALEQERKKKKALRLALEDLLDMVHSDAAQNAERVLNETAGKESEG